VPLFDHIERTYKNPALHTENLFSFYNRSASPGAEKVRELFENWFNQYPDEKKRIFAKKIRQDFYPSFFELFTYSLLRMCFEDVVVEPGIGNKTPDFFVNDNGNRILIESTVILAESKEIRARKNIEYLLYDEINKQKIPDFFLWIVELNMSIKQTPPIGTIAKNIKEKADLIDYNKALKKVYILNLEYPEYDCYLKVGFIPRRKDVKWLHRPIGGYPTKHWWGGSEQFITKAVRKKAHKYNHLNIPIIIVVNNLSSRTWKLDSDTLTALYGINNKKSIHDLASSIEENINAVWIGPEGPRNRNVVAVKVGSIIPSNIPRANLCLYPNPWANKIVDLSKFRIPKFNPNSGEIIDTNLTLGRLFDLPDDWPGRLFI